MDSDSETGSIDYPDDNEVNDEYREEFETPNYVDYEYEEPVTASDNAREPKQVASRSREYTRDYTREYTREHATYSNARQKWDDLVATHRSQLTTLINNRITYEMRDETSFYIYACDYVPSLNQFLDKEQVEPWRQRELSDVLQKIKAIVTARGLKYVSDGNVGIKVSF